MYYNRGALKREAKHLVGRGNPAVYLVTLVFLLATSWVSNLADLILPSPLTNVMVVFDSWAETLSGGYLSQGAMDAMVQEMLSCFTGTQAMIAMLVSLLITFYSWVVNLGYYGYTLKVMRGQPNDGYRELFSHFYLAGKVILLQVLKMVFIYLWSMLFLFPGLIAAYRYRMAEYALLDDPDISALEAIRRSKRMMRGHKMNLFITDLSFIGWLLLTGLASSLVLGGVSVLSSSAVLYTLTALVVETVIDMFLFAYQSLTYAGFYRFLVDQQAPPVDPPNSGFDPTGRPFNTPDDEGWNR